MRSCVALAAVVVLSVAAAFAQRPSLDWNFAHPGADMLGSINVKALRESPHWRRTSDAGAKASPEIAAMERFVAALSDIDTAAISVQSRAKGSADVLLLLEGRFESGALKAMVEQYAKTASVRQITPSLLLIGEPGPVSAAAKRMAAPPVLRAGLQARARRLSAEHDLIICGAPKVVPAQAGAAQGIKEFVAGVSFGAIAVSIVEIETQTAAAADQMVAEYKKVMAQAAAAPAAAQVFRVLSEAAKLERTSPTHLRFRVEARPADIQSLQTLAPMLRSGMAQGTAQAGSQPQTQPASAPQRAPEGKIVIHGLEGGPREIPMK